MFREAVYIIWNRRNRFLFNMNGQNVQANIAVRRIREKVVETVKLFDVAPMSM